MKVLVAIDYIDEPHAALDMLLERAWPPGTVIRVVSVIERLDSLADFIGVKDPSDTWVTEQTRVDETLSYLFKTSQSTAAKLHGVAFEERVLCGYVKEELIMHAEIWSADLVVVGSHDKGALERMLLGSVSHSVLEHAPCPVHIARPTGRGAGDPLNILVPIDYSPHSYATIDWVLRQNFKQPFQIKLLTVLPPFSTEYAHEENPEKASLMLARIQEIKVNATARLNQFTEKMEQQLGKNVVRGEFVEGTPKDMILQAAKDWHAHLIIMGSHGLTGLKRFLLGSVSKAVASHAQCSVEVVRTLKEELPPEPPPVEVARWDEEPRTPHVVVPH